MEAKFILLATIIILSVVDSIQANNNKKTQNQDLDLKTIIKNYEDNYINTSYESAAREVALGPDTYYYNIPGFGDSKYDDAVNNLYDLKNLQNVRAIERKKEIIKIVLEIIIIIGVSIIINVFYKVIKNYKITKN